MKVRDENAGPVIQLPMLEVPAPRQHAELMPVGEGAPLALSVNVVSEGMALQVSDLLGRVASLKVSDADAFKAGTALLNDLQRAGKGLDERRLQLAKPYREAIAQLDAQAKPVLAKLAAAKDGLNGALVAFEQAQQEALRLAALEAEQQRLKAEALAKEAAAREEAAAKAVERAKGQAGFERAAQAFDHAQVVKAEAAEMAAAAVAAPLPEVAKGRGVKQVKVVELLEVTDLAALPLTYHMADEAKLKKAILAGIVDSSTPGLRFKVGLKFSGTGR